jgi:hypothetical protein
MPERAAPARGKVVVASRTTTLARPFLPSLDLVVTRPSALKELSDNDKRQVLATKIADVTHFQVGLSTLHRHVTEALNLVPVVRALPKAVRGQVLEPDLSSADRISVQPALPGTGQVLGRGVVTDEFGVFTLPLPEVSDAQRLNIISNGLGLRFTGRNATQKAVVPLPPAGAVALGEIVLENELQPLPQSVIGALIDLVEDLPGVAPSPATNGNGHAPIRVQLGQDACNIVFEENAILRRFPYRILVRLVEPRTTTVNEVFVPSGRFLPNPDLSNKFVVPIWDIDLLDALSQEVTRFVERVPIDKPISVDGFRDQLIGLTGKNIGSERTVPMAGTLGLGYVLNLAQVWKYAGLTLGNLLYSLPLAPGEQQRIAVSERVSTASVVERELVDIAEQQHSSLRDDASTQAVFDSAFEEHVTANSSYRNEARSSSWGVAGGIGAVLGPVALGVGAGGGGGSSSNTGSTHSALDGARTYTSSAAESMHRFVEREASGRRRAQRTSIRLATETDRETVTTKVITNHNKAHALTIQYWEVLRKFAATTEVEGVNLVCFVPLDLIRFLPPGQPLGLTEIAGVDTRTELLERYGLLHRHADAIQPWLPGRHREGLRVLEDFAANPLATVSLSGPASDVLTFSLKGTFVPYERVWVRILFRGNRRIGPVSLDSPLTIISSGTFGTRAELIEDLKKRRDSSAGDTTMTGSAAIPEALDKSEIIGFEIARAFRPLDYQLDPAKNPSYQALKTLENFGIKPDLSAFEAAVHLSPAELEQLLGGPFVHDFSAKINNAGDSIASDTLGSKQELPPGGLPLAATERNPTVNFRDLLKIERTLQHVVRNTLMYSKAVWSSLTPEERVVMLEGYTIGLPADGLNADGVTDPSQHVPLLNCVANQVLGYYGNCMIMPFSIPASLATKLAGDPDAEDADDRPPLTTGAVQEALTRFHKQAFSPPVSQFTLPTRGVLGEAVLGHCPSAEKIDLSRFWNWQDSPGDAATEITGVTLRPSTVGSLAAPATLSGVPTIINNVAGEGGTTPVGGLATTLAGKASQGQDFSTDFLGLDVEKTLGQKTIETAESARADALGKATQMASQAMTAATDVFKTAQASKDAKEAAQKADQKADAEKKATEEKAAAKAKTDKQEAALKDLKENASSYLGVANSKPDPDKAKEYAQSVLKDLAGEDPLPPSMTSKLFDVYDQKEGTPPVRTTGSTAWLIALGLI